MGEAVDTDSLVVASLAGGAGEEEHEEEVAVEAEEAEVEAVVEEEGITQ